MQEDSRHPDSTSPQSARPVEDAVDLQGNSPLAREHYRRNFSLGFVNGVLVFFGSAFAHSVYVLPVLLWKLTGLKSFAGLIMFLDILGWNWPQMWVSHRLEGQPYALPWYRSAVFVRAAAYMALVFLAFSVRWGGGWVTAILIILVFFTYRSGVGFAGVPFFELVCKTIPVKRRGRFFGSRRIVGGVLAVFAGILVKRLFVVFPYPRDYFYIFLIGAFGCVLGPVAYCFVIEPRGDSLPPSPSFRTHLRRASKIFRNDPAFRRLVWCTAFFTFATFGRGLYGTYCIERLNFPENFMGGLISLSMSTLIVGNLIWTYLSDHKGNRIVLRCAAVLMFIAPSGFLLAPVFPVHSVKIVLASVCVASLSQTAHLMGWLNMLLEIAPGDKRPRYVGFMNLLKIPLSLAFLLAGVGADIFSYELIFALSLIAGILLIPIVWAMPEPRDKLKEIEEPERA